MKKLFTLVVAMALVSMSFAQGLLINTNTQVQLPENQRSDWYGFYATSGSVFIMAAESEYCLRIPEGEIPAGAQLERVRFYHTNSDHVTGNNVPTFNNETYVVRIYTGTTYDATAHRTTLFRMVMMVWVSTLLTLLLLSPCPLLAMSPLVSMPLRSLQFASAPLTLLAQTTASLISQMKLMPVIITGYSVANMMRTTNSSLPTNPSC